MKTKKNITLLKEDTINVNKRLIKVKVKRILIKNHDHMLPQDT